MMEDIQNPTRVIKYTRSEAGLVVEPFLTEDVLDLKLWARHEDVRYSHYDFSLFQQDEIFYRWHKIKTSFGRRLFAIKEEERVVGFISLREFNLFRSSATLGVVMDPAHISKGLGQRALGLFLDIFFEDMGCKVLKLKVSDFNTRARHVYEKLGFEYLSSKLEAFENQMNPFPLLLSYEDFVMVGDEIYTMVSAYAMSLNRYLYLKNEVNQCHNSFNSSRTTVPEGTSPRP